MHMHIALVFFFRALWEGLFAKTTCIHFPAAHNLLPALVTANGSDGTFLIRPKGADPSSGYILSVVYKGKPTHHALGEDETAVFFFFPFNLLPFFFFLIYSGCMQPSTSDPPPPTPYHFYFTTDVFERAGIILLNGGQDKRFFMDFLFLKNVRRFQCSFVSPHLSHTCLLTYPPTFAPLLLQHWSMVNQH